MPWTETGDPLDPWLWVRDPPTEALPVVLPRRIPGATPLPPAPVLPLTEPTRLVATGANPDADLSERYETGDVPDPTEEDPVKLSREPALLYIGLLAPVVQALAAFVFGADPHLQGAVNALAVALAGAITAALVRADNLVPMIVGAFQAVLALILALGVALSSEQQAAVMVAVGAVAAVVVRDRVVAPVPAVATATRLAAAP